MLKNDNKILDKLILITFLALFCSFLSALYISAVHAAAIVPNEIMQPGTQPNEAGNFKSPDKCDNSWQATAILHPKMNLRRAGEVQR